MTYNLLLFTMLRTGAHHLAQSLSSILSEVGYAGIGLDDRSGAYNMALTLGEWMQCVIWFYLRVILDCHRESLGQVG
jgi:hypothetical protein